MFQNDETANQRQLVTLCLPLGPVGPSEQDAPNH